MDNLKLDNTNSFGAFGYTFSWVPRPKSTFGGIFKDEVVLLADELIADRRFAQLGDVKEAYNILESKMSNLKNVEFEDGMRYVAETVQEYFGDYSNVSKRLENYPNENEVKEFSMRGKISDLQGKNAAVCVERAMLSQNLLKYISQKFPGLESYFKVTGIEIQREGNKPKREAHAFNLVFYKGNYYIFDSTIPKGTKDNLQPIVAELPEHIFTSLVEIPGRGHAVELEHVSALTGKKMHYILDYRAEEKFKANEELVNNGQKNVFMESIKVLPEELADNIGKQQTENVQIQPDKKDGPSLDD